VSRIRVTPETLIKSSHQMKAASKSTEELLAHMISLTQSVDATIAGDAGTAAHVERFAQHMKQQVQLAVDVFAALGNSIEHASHGMAAADKSSAAKIRSAATGGTSPTPPVKK
jgi:uncharacterized protein YukE